MDTERFDAITRALRTGASRRAAIGTLLGGALAGLLGAAETTTAKRKRLRASSSKKSKGKPGKVKLCHRTGSEQNPFVLISVSKNALATHLDHGDVYPNRRGKCPQPPPVDVCPGECEEDTDCQQPRTRSGNGDDVECVCKLPDTAASTGTKPKGTCERRPRDICPGTCNSNADCPQPTSAAGGNGDIECFCRLPNGVSTSSGSDFKGTCERRPRDVCPGECDDDSDCPQPRTNAGGGEEIACVCKLPDATTRSGGTTPKGTCERRPPDVCPGKCNSNADCPQPRAAATDGGDGSDLECVCTLPDGVSASSGGGELKGTCEQRRDICPGRCNDDDDCPQPVTRTNAGDERRCICDTTNVSASSGDGSRGVCRLRRDDCPDRCAPCGGCQDDGETCEVQACTHGFWKNQECHWPDGYDGEDLQESEGALSFQRAAARLNRATFGDCFPLTAAEIERATAAQLEAANEAGSCPLDACQSQSR